MTAQTNSLISTGTDDKTPLYWKGSEQDIGYSDPQIQSALLDLNSPCYLIKDSQGIGAATSGQFTDSDNAGKNALAFAPALPVENLGDPEFKKLHGCKYAYLAGSMAHGISSKEMVIALGKAGFLASFGAGGIVPDQLEKIIQEIQNALPNGPYAFNLIHNPFAEAMEKSAVDLYLKYGVQTVEASAFMDLTRYVVQYRAAGLCYDDQGNIEIKNKIIAKISRREVALRFMEPAPDKFLKQLLADGLITATQAEIAAKVPMADDITVEADSGGHTDNRPLVSLLPSMIALRNEIQEKHNYPQPIRIGAAGGIGTPESTLAAFIMGAAYVVTGSVNQGCVESGTSLHARKLLTEVGMADVTMAPAFDMFEMGGKLQVVKRSTLFPMRAKKLNDLYNSCKSIEEIPAEERKKLETQLFKKDLDQIWQETVDYFQVRDPEQINKALKNPRKKMALIFRWYLGQASHWANKGEKGREMDYQIWCGPSMGAFNDWVRGSYLEDYQQRKSVDVAMNLLKGAAYLYRLQQLKNQQVWFPAKFSTYCPVPQ